MPTPLSPAVLMDWLQRAAAVFAAQRAHLTQLVQNRGKAAVGDKTMLDALTPALAALREAGADAPLAEALRRSAEAADAGAQSTIPLVARKGRASYLGERSAGHLDPGAASSTLLLAALADAAA